MDPLGLALGLAFLFGASIFAIFGAARKTSPAPPPSTPTTPAPPDPLTALATRLSRPGLSVAVESYSIGEGAKVTEFVVSGVAKEDVSCRRSPAYASPLSPVPPGSLHLDTRQSSDIEVGDPEFDQAFLVTGRTAAVLARFDSATRAAALSLLKGTVRVEQVSVGGGQLSVEVPTTGFAGAHPGLEIAGRAAVDLAALLAAPLDVPRRLLANVLHDPLPGVRVRSLAALAEGFAQQKVLHEALQAAARDADPEVRLRAGLELGAEGHGLLLALAEDGTVADSCSARALLGLGENVPDARAASTLMKALQPAPRSAGPGRPHTAQACVTALARHRSVPATTALGQALQAASGDLARAIAQALGDGGRAEAEAPLLQALASVDGDRSRAAAVALGAVGSVAAVLPLQEAAARHGGPMKSLARQSIAEIQSRLSGTPGSISLAGEETAGQVSIAGADAGQVTMAEDDEPPRK